MQQSLSGPAAHCLDLETVGPMAYLLVSPAGHGLGCCSWQGNSGCGLGRRNQTLLDASPGILMRLEGHLQRVAVPFSADTFKVG